MSLKFYDHISGDMNLGPWMNLTYVGLIITFIMYVTCLWFSSTQSLILKHSGDLSAAASLADEARCMDLADRYVNSECVKRMLQADQVQNFICFLWSLIKSLTFAGNFQYLWIILHLSFDFFMAYAAHLFEGGFSWKDSFIIHKRRGSTEQPLRYAVHVVSFFTELNH